MLNKMQQKNGLAALEQYASIFWQPKQTETIVTEQRHVEEELAEMDVYFAKRLRKAKRKTGDKAKANRDS